MLKKSVILKKKSMFNILVTTVASLILTFVGVIGVYNYVPIDFIEKFNFARIWGKSVKHSGSNVGLEHVLKEGDIVEIHTK